MNDKLSIPQTNAYQIFKEQVQIAFRSGLLPKAVDTPEKAIAIALTGRELGLKPMESLNGLYVVNGKVTMSAQLMLRLIYERVPGALINVMESDDTACQVEMARPGHKPQFFSYTLEEAHKAGFTSKEPWRKHPATMLRWSAIRTGARIVFADAIAGCYMPDELDHLEDGYQPRHMQKVLTKKVDPEKTQELELPTLARPVLNQVNALAEKLDAKVESIEFEKMPWENEKANLGRAMIPHGKHQGTILANWSVEECAKYLLEQQRVLAAGDLNAKQEEQVRENIETVRLYLESKEMDVEYERKLNED